METNFSNTKYQINGETRLSVTFWEYHNQFRGSVAIMRLVAGEWKIDSETVKDIGSDRDWLTKSRSAMIEGDLYKAETGDVMPLGFYKNNRLGKLIAS